MTGQKRWLAVFAAIGVSVLCAILFWSQQVEWGRSNETSKRTAAFSSVNNSDLNKKSTIEILRTIDFQARWNDLARGMEPDYVISSSFLGPVPLKQQQQSQQQQSQQHNYRWPDRSQLFIHSALDGTVHQLVWDASAHTTTARFRMFSAWSMLIAMVEPHRSVQEVNSLLFELGANPNGKFSFQSNRVNSSSNWNFRVEQKNEQIILYVERK